MKDISVLELMVPLTEYATVSQDATLHEAIRSLEKARVEFEEKRYRHRAVLVYDENRRIVGKLSQIDIIKALEPDHARKLGEEHLSRFGISEGYLEAVINEHDLWNLPMDQHCSAAGRQRVADIMYTPTEGEYIRSDASLQEAVHRLILGHHHSLLVTEGDDIIGVLRLADVFSAVCETMKRIFEDKGST
jgi:CBS domain-containing protein